MAGNKNPKWLAIGEASKYLGISRDTLRRWEKRGLIAPRRSPSNRRYYTKEILNQAMAAKKSPRPAATSAQKITSAKTSSKQSFWQANSQLLIFGGISFLLTVMLVAGVLILAG